MNVRVGKEKKEEGVERMEWGGLGRRQQDEGWMVEGKTDGWREGRRNKLPCTQHNITKYPPHLSVDCSPAGPAPQ